MSWVVVGVTAGSALMGAQQAKRQREAQKSQNMAAASQTEFSPWTGMGAGEMNNGPTQSALEGGLSGGLKGFMTGKSIDGAMSKTAVPDPSKGVDAANFTDQSLNAPMDPMQGDNPWNQMGKKRPGFYGNGNVIG